MRLLALSTVLLIGPPSLASAQKDCLQQMKLPKTGTWAEYRTVSQQQKEPRTMRWAVIGAESRAGKELQWVEMRMTGDKPDQNVITQMLVPGSMDEMDQVQEVVFKAGERPAMKVSGSMLSMMKGQLEQQSFFKRACEGVTLVGQEKVTVPAGTFQTSHFRSAEHGVDSWVAPGAPFSMVKTTGKDFQMELTAQGEGAKSSIPEKPQEMPGMGGPSSH
jgi:hypothetical protein